MLQKLNTIEQRYQELETLLASDIAVTDQNKYQQTAKEYAHLGPLVQVYREYKALDKECTDITGMIADASTDATMKEFYLEEKQSAERKREAVKLQLEEMLLDEEDPNKDKNIIVEIRAGTGGEEAALFAADLFRMYSKYADTCGFKIDMMSANETGIGGFKEVVFSVEGHGCYKKFRFESGTHRVQRVPTTETCGRIHTSAVTVAVLPEAEDVEVDINPEDLRIDTYRASGAGGQHVNKTESAIRITHFPTNTVVTCQDEKSQHKNKAKAMRILRTRIFERMQQEHMNEISQNRKQQVGSGDRSQRIRTYNFAERRVTDHRIGLTLHALDTMLEGDIEALIIELEKDDRQKRLTSE